MNDTQAPDLGSVAKGLGLTLLLHVAGAVVISAGSGILSGDPRNGLALFLGIGVVQLFYVLPAAIVLAKRGRQRTLKGLWIGAGITALLNAACAGIVIASLSSGNFH